MKFVFGFLSGGISRKTKKNGSIYSFLFVHPDGKQLAEIGELLSEGKILPVIDKHLPVGLQILAPHLGEAKLLQIAKAAERD